MSPARSFVIVGAGMAGAKAAEALRAEGFDGRVVLIGDEGERPYERPPLSKDYLRGEAERPPFLQEADFYAAHDIELRADAPVAGIDASAHEVALDDGERIRYDRLLLSTGAAPRRLSIPGGDLGGVHYLRTLRDADVLRARLDRGGSLVVVGAGWIGSEVAASGRQRGLEVTLVDPLAAPLERVLGPEVGAVYREIHADHGVRMRLETGVEAFEGAGTVERVRTTDGRALDCDLVVVGIGVLPRTELAARAGLAVDDGIRVDEQLQTSAPGVYAAGDVASARHPLYRDPVRVEHWANALHQGAAAAMAMLGRPVSYDRIPYFFSDQFESGMEYTGLARRWDRVVFRGDPTSREFVAFWLDAGRVVAGMNFNVWGVADAIAQLIRAGVPVDPRRLADPDVPLEATAPASATG